MIVVYRKIMVVLSLLVMIIAVGCGTKPMPEVPLDVTAAEALKVLQDRTDDIHDFTGRASIALDINGSRESAGMAIRYISPDEIRATVNVTLGIPVAVITAISDSVTIYDTQENVYIRVSRSQAPAMLRVLNPDVKIDPGLLQSLLSVTLPPPDEIGLYTSSIQRIGRNAVLRLTSTEDINAYSYLLEGPDLRVIEEVVTLHGVTIWSKRVTDFGSDNDVVFPGKMTISDRGRDMEVEFSRYSINTGLQIEDLIFEIPSSARRLYIGPR